MYVVDPCNPVPRCDKPPHNVLHFCLSGHGISRPRYIRTDALGTFPPKIPPPDPLLTPSQPQIGNGSEGDTHWSGAAAELGCVADLTGGFQMMALDPQGDPLQRAITLRVVGQDAANIPVPAQVSGPPPDPLQTPSGPPPA
eukprot:130225-Prorocentrum_minimum.AAC.1